MWARGGEGFLAAIFDVVGVDAVDGVEELGILLKVSWGHSVGKEKTYIVAGRHGQHSCRRMVLAVRPGGLNGSKKICAVLREAQHNHSGIVTVRKA